MTRAHPVRRALGGVVGLVVFALGGVLTLGTALAAPVGMGIAGWLAQRRGGQLPRSRSWLAAACGATLAWALLLAAILISQGPQRFFETVQTASETRPPTWIERAAPPNPRVEGIVHSRPFLFYIVLLTVGLMCLVLGMISGTVGWGGALLISYAIKGRWPGSRPPDIDFGSTSLS